MARRRSYGLVTFCCLIVLFASFACGYYLHIFKNKKNDDTPLAQQDARVENEREYGDSEFTGNREVPDDPRHEGGEGIMQLNRDYVQSANINDDPARISDDTKIQFIRKYLRCGHQIIEEIDAPVEMINATEEILAVLYSHWKIEEFSEKKVILSMEIDEQCPNHYYVKEYNGKVALFYQKPVNGQDFIRYIDEINLYLLRQDDREKIKEGIPVNSDEELAQLLEDFNS
ncbi:MAG: hypothetical protein GX066_04325 [Clostridiaceae bacterium]|nr:hypothetical protein [Clostridiaceae bacterium]